MEIAISHRSTRRPRLSVQFPYPSAARWLSFVGRILGFSSSVFLGIFASDGVSVCRTVQMYWRWNMRQVNTRACIKRDSSLRTYGTKDSLLHSLLHASSHTSTAMVSCCNQDSGTEMNGKWEWFGLGPALFQFRFTRAHEVVRALFCFRIEHGYALINLVYISNEEFRTRVYCFT